MLYYKFIGNNAGKYPYRLGLNTLKHNNETFDAKADCISLDADIHANNDEALRWASLVGCLDIVEYLISLGADIHAVSEYSSDEDE